MLEGDYFFVGCFKQKGQIILNNEKKLKAKEKLLTSSHPLPEKQPANNLVLSLSPDHVKIAPMINEMPV